MRDRPDLYVILGVEPSATPAAIQVAYRQRVQVIHPDRIDRVRTPAAWVHANTMLRELNDAYSTLSEPRRRREYDLAHAAAPVVSRASATSTTTTEGGRSRGPIQVPRRTPSFGVVAALSSVLLLIAWALIADRAQRRDTDAFFLSSGSQQASGPPKSLVIPPPTKAGQQPSLTVAVIAPPAVVSPTPTAPPPAAETKAEPVGCEPGADQDALPANAQVWRYGDAEPLAPIEIRVKGAEHYLVKLERKNITTAMMLVRASSVAEMLVPLGDYTLKYATGSGDYWCGVDAKFPFGRQTTFHKADKLMSFRREADHYSGYKIELILQEHGNLGTSSLSPKAW